MKSLLDKVNAKLNAQGGFLKAVSVLVGGTAFAQGIAILVLPILTRLYTPEDFSLFAIYTSLLLILSVASCLRFEIAIPIPKSDNEAVHLVLLALLSNLIISVLLSIIILVFHSEIILLLKQPDFVNLIWLIPVGVLFLGIYNTLQYWATRKKKFSIVAKSRIIQSICGISVQLVMGVLGAGGGGLIIGHIIKTSASMWGLILSFWHDARDIIKQVTFRKSKVSFSKNNNYPKYSTLEALANTIGIQLPIVIMAALSINSEAGYLMLAMQILMIPMGLIGGAVSQVYLAHASEKYYIGELRAYTVQSVLQLIKVGLFPLVLLCLLAPIVVPLIFGVVWQRSGEMILWMLPWFAMQLIVSPVSMSLYILGRQKVALLLQVFGLIVRVGGIWIVSECYFEYTFEYYSISSFLFYLIYFFIVFVCLKGK